MVTGMQQPDWRLVLQACTWCQRQSVSPEPPAPSQCRQLQAPPCGPSASCAMCPLTSTAARLTISQVPPASCFLLLSRLPVMLRGLLSSATAASGCCMLSHAVINVCTSGGRMNRQSPNMRAQSEALNSALQLANSPLTVQQLNKVMCRMQGMSAAAQCTRSSQLLLPHLQLLTPLARIYA